MTYRLMLRRGSGRAPPPGQEEPASWESEAISYSLVLFFFAECLSSSLMSPGGLPLLTDGTAWLPAASPGDLVFLELTGCNPGWVAPAEAVSTLGLSHCDQGTDRVAQAIPVRMGREWAEEVHFPDPGCPGILRGFLWCFSQTSASVSSWHSTQSASAWLPSVASVSSGSSSSPEHGLPEPWEYHPLPAPAASTIGAPHGLLTRDNEVSLRDRHLHKCFWWRRTVMVGRGLELLPNMLFKSLSSQSQEVF